MASLTPSDIALQNAGKYLRWKTQETGSTTVNGVPTAGNSGVSVLESQKTKIAVTPNSGATLSFRVWIEYTGRQGFYLADGFDRAGITTAWTQEINTSGASRLYVEVTAIDIGNFDVEMAVAGVTPTLVGRPTLTNELFVWDSYSYNPYAGGDPVLGLKNLADTSSPGFLQNPITPYDTYQPSGLNSRPSVDFKSSSSSFETNKAVSGNNPWSIVFAGIARENTESNFNAVSAWGTQSAGQGVILLCRFSGTFEWAIGGFGSSFDLRSGITPRSGGDVVIITSDGTTTTLYVNGTSAASASLTWSLSTATPLQIGKNISGEHYVGDMGALIFAQDSVSPSQATAFTDYYSERFGIPQ